LLNQVARAAPLEQWHSFFKAGCLPPGPSRPVVVHGDLAAEHVLFDPTKQKLTGIIDWSEIAVSDCSVDLAGCFHWGGEPCINAVLSAYEGLVDEKVLTRARFLAACRGVGDIAFGLKTARPEYIEAGVRALSLCLGGVDHA